VGAASKKSVKVVTARVLALAEDGVVAAAAVINDANGCFTNDGAKVEDFGLTLAGTNNRACAGAGTGAEIDGASLVFHSSLKYFELFVYII
jgi:hypothetical protein